jgi:Domain of unknown function (DUF4396)
VNRTKGSHVSAVVVDNGARSNPMEDNGARSNPQAKVELSRLAALHGRLPPSRPRSTVSPAALFGEILGMAVSTWLGLSNAGSILVSVVLAFAFGYALTIRPVLRAGVPFPRALRLALASDTLSIATMELVDNAFIVLVPGALAAGLSDALFW